MESILIGAACAVIFIIVLALEMRANNKRIERGEAPVRHHDITDWPNPVDVIDRTPKKRR